VIAVASEYVFTIGSVLTEMALTPAQAILPFLFWLHSSGFPVHVL